MTSHWKGVCLDIARTEADPEADAVVAELFKRPDVFKTLLEDLIRNGDAVPLTLPSEVRAYFENIRPAVGVDLAKLKAGRELFDRYAPEICWLLSCASLPTCYACERGAKVLEFSTRLTNASFARRRIFETAQFVLDVMDAQGFEASGRGLRSIQMVRLMHAGVRHHILARQGGQDTWDKSWGVPINQEDLANTLLSFSVTVLDGLKSFKLDVTDEQAEGYLYLWNQIGLMLGVKPELIPNDVREGRELLNLICERNWKQGSAGTSLINTLSEFAKELVPGKLFDGVFEASVYLCFPEPRGGQLLPVVLGIQRSPLENLLRDAVKITDDIEHSLAARVTRHFSSWRITRHLGFELIQGYLRLAERGARKPFRIPESLQPQFTPSMATRLRSAFHRVQLGLHMMKGQPPSRSSNEMTPTN